MSLTALHACKLRQGWARSNALKSTWVEASRSTFQRILFVVLSTCKQYACSVRGMSMRTNPELRCPRISTHDAIVCLMTKASWGPVVTILYNGTHFDSQRLLPMAQVMTLMTSITLNGILKVTSWQTAERQSWHHCFCRRLAESHIAWMPSLGRNQVQYAQQSLQLKLPHLSQRFVQHFECSHLLLSLCWPHPGGSCTHGQKDPKIVFWCTEQPLMNGCKQFYSKRCTSIIPPFVLAFQLHVCWRRDRCTDKLLL